MESPTSTLDTQISRLTLQEQGDPGTDELIKQLSSLTLHGQDDPFTKELADGIFKMTLQEHNVTVDGPGAPPISSPTAIPHPFAGVLPLQELLHDPELADRQYQRLCRIDENLNSHAEEVLLKLDSLASSDSTADNEVLRFMKEQDTWLKEELAKAEIFQAAKPFVINLKNAVIERLLSVIDMVDCYALILSNREENKLPESASTYDTGEWILMSLRRSY